MIKRPSQSLCNGKSLRTRSKRLGSVPSLRGQIRKSPFQSGSSQDISIVPEDLEMPPNQPNSKFTAAQVIGNHEPNVAMAFLRKRSSSLPRILPPILDRDCFDEEDNVLEDDDVLEDAHSEVGSRLSAFKQMDQTSNLIVREMQKFVCRIASDVSQVLPLPLPANSRQQQIIRNNGKNRIKLDWKHSQVGRKETSLGYFWLQKLAFA